MPHFFWHPFYQNLVFWLSPRNRISTQKREKNTHRHAQSWNTLRCSQWYHVGSHFKIFWYCASWWYRYFRRVSDHWFSSASMDEIYLSPFLVHPSNFPLTKISRTVWRENHRLSYHAWYPRSRNKTSYRCDDYWSCRHGWQRRWYHETIIPRKDAQYYRE